jgi:hypothetical protein
MIVMKKVIPILPCPEIKKQVEFYGQLGFEVTGVYTSPNPYATIQLGAVELHFYGSKKIVPAENSSMCYINVDDLDTIYTTFASAFKKNTGKVPRSGIPRISKIRDLVNDRRFTLTDVGGNTLFIGNQDQRESGNFFRTLESKEWRNKFTVLYDLLYSKEDLSMAAGMMQRFSIAKESLNNLDKAKLLLVTLEIHRQLEQPTDDADLKDLIKTHGSDNDDWKQVNAKYQAMRREDY